MSDDERSASIGMPDGPAVLFYRGQPVLLADRVAQAFGVATRAVNQAAKRNPRRFTANHTFQLTTEEAAALRSQNVIPKPGRGGSREAPWVFTQKGVMQLACVLNSRKAIEATDLMIDIFNEVHRQIVLGKSDIAIPDPGRLVPDQGDAFRIRKLRDQLYDAVENLLGTVIDTKHQTTLRQELEDIGGTALSNLREHLKTRGLENEKIAADTLMILERVREIREKTAVEVRKTEAETETVLLENLDKRITLVERILEMARKMEPNAVATLLPGFARKSLLPGPESAADAQEIPAPDRP